MTNQTTQEVPPVEAKKLRSPSINEVRLVGHLTSDPEMRFTASGKEVVRFTIGVNRSYKDSKGEWHDEASFIPVRAWNGVARRVVDKAKKGTPVYVQGQLRSNNWVTKENEKRTSIEVYPYQVQILQTTIAVEAEQEETEAVSTGEEPGAGAEQPE